jgi:hypothetical protein
MIIIAVEVSDVALFLKKNTEEVSDSNLKFSLLAK